MWSCALARRRIRGRGLTCVVGNASRVRLRLSVVVAFSLKPCGRWYLAGDSGSTVPTTDRPKIVINFAPQHASSSAKFVSQQRLSVTIAASNWWLSIGTAGRPARSYRKRDRIAPGRYPL